MALVQQSKESLTNGHNSKFKISNFLDSLLKRISYKVYMLLVALIFGILSLLLGIDIWVSPIFQAEYNIAINLFTSSIFTVIGIILLTLFVTLREEREWRIVKNEVHEMINTGLMMIFHEVLGIIDGGLSYKLNLSQADKQTKKQLIKDELKALNEEEIKLNKSEVTCFLNSNECNVVCQNLSNIEFKYSKHLPAEVIFSLVRLQMSMQLIDISKRLNDKMKELTNESNAQIVVMLTQINPRINEMSIELIKPSIKEIIKHLSILYSKGYEFDYY